MKKIYFAGSIRGGRKDVELYFEIIKLLKDMGHSVFTEHVGLKDLEATGEIGQTQKQIYERDMAWLKECDAVIAEVTSPSLGVGYEIAHAENLGKPILCLYRPSPDKSLSAMIAGSPHLTVLEYKNVLETKDSIAQFIKLAAN